MACVLGAGEQDGFNDLAVSRCLEPLGCKVVLNEQPRNILLLSP